MHSMLQADEPETFVLATGRTLTVRDFVTMAFAGADMKIEWSGQGIDEIGREMGTGKTLVRINPSFYRPAEVEMLIGNSAKARKKLGWAAQTTVEELCRVMVEADLRRNVAGARF
jgi:GDPmannose 4,6-dehydratase